MTYDEMLAGRGLKVGDQVVCTYRIPSALQWWIHPFWIGVIEPASTDTGSWNGRTSEADFCVLVRDVKLRYLANPTMNGFTQLDSLGDLLPLEFGTVEQSPYFGDRSYDELRAFAARCGLLDRYPVRRTSHTEVAA